MRDQVENETVVIKVVESFIYSDGNCEGQYDLVKSFSKSDRDREGQYDLVKVGSEQSLLLEEKER